MISIARPNNEGAIDCGVREIVGVFTDCDELEDAVEDLQLAGIDREQIHLLTSCRAAEAKLGHEISDVRELEDEPNLPHGNYTDRHERAEGAAALVSGLALLGSFTMIGAVVARGGTLALTIMAALAAGGVGGSLGGLLIRALGTRRAQQIEEQLRRGGLLLWVELKGMTQERRALEILQRYSCKDVHVRDLARGRSAAEGPVRHQRCDPLLPNIR